MSVFQISFGNISVILLSAITPCRNQPENIRTLCLTTAQRVGEFRSMFESGPNLSAERGIPLPRSKKHDELTAEFFGIELFQRVIRSSGPKPIQKTLLGNGFKHWEMVLSRNFYVNLQLEFLEPISYELHLSGNHESRTGVLCDGNRIIQGQLVIKNQNSGERQIINDS
jgi:hypothetical protein